MLPLFIEKNPAYFKLYLRSNQQNPLCDNHFVGCDEKLRRAGKSL